MQTKKEHIKNKIIEYFKEELTEKDFQQVSMRDLAKKSKTSIGNIYNYFENKEKLFYHIMDPFYIKINNLLNKFINRDIRHEFGSEDYINQSTQLIIELINNYKDEFLILLEKSVGTKYENYKSDLTRNIILSFKKDANILSEKNKPELAKKVEGIENEFIIHLISKNFVDNLNEFINFTKNHDKNKNELKSIFTLFTDSVTKEYNRRGISTSDFI